MAKHRAATEVTVASMTESGSLQVFVQKYWLPVLVLLGALVGLILFKKHREDAARVERMQSWSGYASLVKPDLTGFPEGDAEALTAAAREVEGTVPAGFLRVAEAVNRLRAGDWDGAREASEAISQELRIFHEPLDGGPPIAARLQEAASKAAEWAEQNTSYFQNPRPADDAPRVQVETSQGTIVIALYEDLAPDLVQRFVARAESGALDNTKFHRVEPGVALHGGDPASVEGPPETWGQGIPEAEAEDDAGAGADAQVDAQVTKFNGLLNFAGSVAAGEAAGIFVINLDDQPDQDGRRIVFGEVVEGLEAAKEIGSSPLAEGTERPLEPVEITSTQVL